jgi:hypothetical protein
MDYGSLRIPASGHCDLTLYSRDGLDVAIHQLKASGSCGHRLFSYLSNSVGMGLAQILASPPALIN